MLECFEFRLENEDLYKTRDSKVVLPKKPIFAEVTPAGLEPESNDRPLPQRNVVAWAH